MRILAIETSCDETAVAVVSERGGSFVVEHNLIASQAKLHAQYGGVVPEVAARSHVEVLMPLIQQTGIAADGSDIDAVAVTAGPGLLPALRIGVEVAKGLAFAWKKPLVPVNHLEGHIYSVWLNAPVPVFPALCLLVSGGHTELIRMRDHGSYELIGMTRDDAAGEAFDKVAKLLGLGYPGGPEISRRATVGNPQAVAFPRPMLESGDFDFSFSGLKTAVSVFLKENAGKTSVDDVAASFQAAVVETLVEKTRRAVARFEPRSVILSGGVSANASLRDALAAALPSTASFHVPALSLTGDNAVMIALAGLFRAAKHESIRPAELIPSPRMRLV